MAGGRLPDGAASAGEETGAGLVLRLFGPMEMRVGSRPLRRLHSRKGLWLLALLALRAGRDVERDWLASVLWLDSDLSHDRHNLRQSLSDLRLALGPESPRLMTEGTRTLRLDVARSFVDVLAFDAALARGDPQSLAEAVSLYRGPLLEGCTEEWCLPERQQREQDYLGALATLAAGSAARGEPTEAAGYLRLAVGVDPYREDLQLGLMEALAAAGNPTAALLVYREYRELLRGEMGAEPAEETTALFQRLRKESRARAKPRAAQRAVGVTPRVEATSLHAAEVLPLPLPLTELIGREEAVRELTELLERAPTQGGYRLVTLTGAGGIGKTRLALQVATELKDQFPDGVCFVELAALSDGALVAATVAASLGMGEPADRPVLESLCVALRDREVLLALDNCEHLAAACAGFADELLRRCAGVRILATSRQPLGLVGEVAWRVPSVEVPGSSLLPAGVKDAVSYFLEYAAVRLFVARAQQADRGFRLTPRDAATVAQICRQLDGVPLAIELAAARARAMPVETIATRLEDRFQLLTGGSRTALPRQQTLRGAIDWSYELLSEAERRLLRRLSVFAGGWTLEAAEAVVSGQWSVVSEPASRLRAPSGHVVCLLPSDVLDLLTSLVEKSLVVYEEQEARARYRLLETVRQYFSERLLESGEGEAIRRQHLDHFLALAEEAEPQLTGAQQGEWLERLETEHDNLRTALAWCFAPVDAPAGGRSGTRHPPPATLHRHEAGLRLAGALWRFWSVRGHLTEGRERLAQALASAPEATTGRAKALETAGTLAYRQADYGSARMLHEESLAIRRELGDRAGIAASLRNLALVAYQQGDYGTARSLQEESLAIRRELGDRVGIAASLQDLALLAYSQGDYRTARSFYEESLAIRRELGERRGIAASLEALAALTCAGQEQRQAGGRRDASLPLPAGCGRPLGTPTGAEAPDCAGAAARPFGAAEALREAISAPLPPNEQAAYRLQVSRVRELLGEEAFGAAWVQGRAMTLEQAIADALGETGGARAPQSTPHRAG
jgi:predicted ATPase/DNA-binding SARP family transcriptional activator